MQKKVYFEQNIQTGREALIENIKLVLYNKTPSIFEVLDFENDKIYTDSFVFAALNSKQKVEVMDVLWGYKSTFLQEHPVHFVSDEFGRIYLPNLGYFNTDKILTPLYLSFKFESYVIKDEKQQEVHFSFEPPLLIHGLFEVIKHPHNLLYEHFFKSEGDLVTVEVTEITQRHLEHVTLAFDHIRDYSYEFYVMLKICLRNIMIFKSNAYEFMNTEVVDRNSFATLSVHGCAFFNAFQDEYNEVFFIEDIAHQGGHVIFNTYLAAKPDIFKIDQHVNIASQEEVEFYEEERSLFVVMHAMFTYDSIITCLSNCIENKVFEGHKLHELLGRLAFNCYKFDQDFELLSQLDNEGNSIFFKDEGKLLLTQFLETYKSILLKHRKLIQPLNLSNQPYNFSYKIFLKNNPI
jgi:hypothetical protein